MKKLFLALCILLSHFNFAQAKGNPFLKAMKYAESVSYTFDYSDTKIDGIKAEDYVGMTLNMPFEKFTSILENILIDSVNEYLVKKGLVLSNEKETDVELKVKLTNVDRDGEHTLLCDLIQKSTQGVIFSFKVNHNGGDNDKFKEELIKRYALSGKSIGKYIYMVKKISLKAK